MMPSVAKLTPLEGLTVADLQETDGLVSRLEGTVVPATYVQLSDFDFTEQHSLSISSEIVAMDEMIKREGLRTDVELANNAAACTTTGDDRNFLPGKGVATLSAALSQAKADRMQIQQREAQLRNSYLDRLFHESVDQIVEATTEEAASKAGVTVCMGCQQPLWIYGRGHSAFARIGLPPEDIVWSCAVCNGDFGAGNALFVCATPDRCAWRVCKTCHDGESVRSVSEPNGDWNSHPNARALVIADQLPESRSQVLAERLAAAYKEATAVAKATSSTVAHVGASQPPSIPRVSGVSYVKQRQLELNRRLGFADIDFVAAPPGRQGRSSRFRSMPAGVARKYEVYD